MDTCVNIPQPGDRLWYNSSAHFSHPAWIEIDTWQLKRNIALIKRHIGKSLFCLPVKANAYGHGLCPIGKIAQEAGVDYLAVAHLQEGIRLRNAGISLPILVLGAIHEEQIHELIAFDLEFSISSRFKADLVAEKCQRWGKRCRVHIEVDTGMQRTGVRTTTAIELYRHLQSLYCFDIVGIYSHFATADHPEDPLALEQIEAFSHLLNHPLFQGTKPAPTSCEFCRHALLSSGASRYGQTFSTHLRLSSFQEHHRCGKRSPLALRSKQKFPISKSFHKEQASATGIRI